MSSIINIAGLAIGITCVMFILFYVQDELGYDRFINNSDLMYEVNIEGNLGGQEFLSGTTPPPAGAALLNSFPEVETYTRIFNATEEVVRSEENNQAVNSFTERNVHGVDSNFLQLFNFKLLQGNAATCLMPPDAVVITNQVAKKYFGNGNAMGKILLFDDEKKPFTVTAILENLPAQSSLQFDMLRPMSSYPIVKRFSWSWVWTQVTTFVKLKDHLNRSALQKLESKFPMMLKQQASNAFRRVGQPLDELEKKGGKYILHLQPLTDVHLHSAGVSSAIATLGDIKYVYIFSLIACFIIILACVNFMNLSTAQSAKRAKEVGIRKVLGSAKSQLVMQFFTEAFIYTIISTVIAMMLVLVLMNSFNQLSGKSLSFTLLFSNHNILYLLAVIIVTGLLAGSYPSFYLTSFAPASVLKGKLIKTSIGNLFLRNGLVIFQFTISTALIICSMVMFQQLQFTRSKNMGLNKDNIMVIANSNRLGSAEKIFREQASEMPGIKKTSITTSLPTKYLFTDGYVPVAARDESIVKDISLSSFIVDEDFVPALQLKIIKGRNFSTDFAEAGSVILNETAVRQIGWKEPIGQILKYPGSGDENSQFRVVGVVKDFNFQSLHTPIAPFALFHSSSKTYDLGISYILARVDPSKTNNVIKQLSDKWKSLAPSTPFDYSFLDEEFIALYQSDNRMGKVFGLFTILSIFVACLGLFGLATYTAERRTKEIGIRKVLGASVQGVVRMLSKEFLKLVLVAALVAFPLAWWAMNKWLEDFAYRINISWQVFVSAGCAVLLITIVTVSLKALKAAVANPVESLRTE
ncbi:MAG: ABC transporter permease [Ginsengibacter sp.]